jgi:hypothetical protein
LALAAGVVGYTAFSGVASRDCEETLLKIQADFSASVAQKQAQEAPGPGKAAVVRQDDGAAAAAGGDMTVHVLRLRKALTKLIDEDREDKNSLRYRADVLVNDVWSFSLRVQDLTDGEIGMLRQFLKQDAGVWKDLESLEPDEVRDGVLARREHSLDEVILVWNTIWEADLRRRAEIVLDAHEGDTEALFRDLQAFVRSAPKPYEMRSVAMLVVEEKDSRAATRETEDGLMAQLWKYRRRETYRHETERAVCLNARILREHPENLISTSDGFTNTIQRWYGAAGGPMRNSDAQRFADYTQQLIEASSLPYLECEAARKKLHGSIKRSTLDVVLGRDLLLDNLINNGRNTRRAVGEVWADFTRLAIALKRYRTEQGPYPETLDAVRERFPKGMPVDPFSGKPYVYTSDGASFRLSSAYKPEGEEGRFFPAGLTLKGGE